MLLELFTSEGCSSCPPADTLLQKLAQQQPLPGADVIALEEHVDYWNHDGWNDPYSSADWTQRQLNYGAAFKTEAYTPQMVVDGQSQFVGSSARDASFAIQKAASSPKTDVAITAVAPDTSGPRHFTVSVGKLMGDTPGDTAEVWIAVTEDGLRSSVCESRRECRTRLGSRCHVAVVVQNRGGGCQRDFAVFYRRSPREIRFSLESCQTFDCGFRAGEKSRKILGAGSTAITPRSGNPQPPPCRIIRLNFDGRHGPLPTFADYTEPLEPAITRMIPPTRASPPRMGGKGMV